MKKIILIAFFAIAALCNKQNIYAQITYEASYTSGYPKLKYFAHMDSKWVLYGPNTILLYNLNHSFYSQISIPAQTATFSIYYLTEDLFDNDSTNLEYLICAVNSPTYFVKIYREDGTLLFNRDSATIFQQAIMTNYELTYNSNVVATETGTKLSVWIFNPPYNRTEIYSLPGHLPCPKLCGIGESQIITSAEPFNSSENKSLNPYPNPSTGQTHIPYQLPEGETSGEIIFYDLAGAEVKRYKVDSTFRDLVLSAEDLSAGSYYYQLQTAGGNSKGKKLIVIK